MKKKTVTGRRRFTRTRDRVALSLVSAILAASIGIAAYNHLVRSHGQSGERRFVPRRDEFMPLTEEQKLERLHQKLKASGLVSGEILFSRAIGFYEYAPSFTQKTSFPGMPDIKAEGPLFHHTHDLGYRIPLAHDESSFETGGLMAGGCSFTYGYGVNAEAAFPDVASTRLGLDSYNYGSCGYSLVSTLDQLRVLEARGILARLKPKHYVLGTGLWQYERSTSPFFPSYVLKYRFPYLSIDSAGNVVRIEPPVHEQMPKLSAFLSEYFPDGDREVPLTDQRRELLRQALARNEKVLAQEREFRTPEAMTPRKMYEFLLPEFKAVCDRNGIEFCAVYVPTKESPWKYRDENPERIEAIGSLVGVSKQLGVRAIVGERIWKKYNLDHQVGFPHHTHPSASTHRALGRLIAEEIGEARRDRGSP